MIILLHGNTDLLDLALLGLGVTHWICSTVEEVLVSF